MDGKKESMRERMRRQHAERVAAERLAAVPRRRTRERVASREEQHARYIDCGPAAWDDKGLSPDY